jgi:hypothetical protein
MSEGMKDWSEAAGCTCGAYDEGDGVWVRITDPFCPTHGSSS